MLAFLYTQNRVGGKIPSTLKIIEPNYIETKKNSPYHREKGEFSHKTMEPRGVYSVDITTFIRVLYSRCTQLNIEFSFSLSSCSNSSMI